MERIGPSTGAPAPKPAHHTISRVTGAPTIASKVLVILLILASLAFIANMTLQLMGRGTTDFGSAKVNKSSYQAIFLTNGQVYFGKLTDVNSEYLQLREIYYLQVNQAKDDSIQNAEDKQQPQISLAKLGKELHGPEDVMYISRDQVLFWENLQGKENSKVTEAIETFKAGGQEN